MKKAKQIIIIINLSKDFNSIIAKIDYSQSSIVWFNYY